MATYYLRPSADIELKHDKNPESSTDDGYTYINEVEPDEDKRCLQHTTTSQQVATISSKFIISGNIPIDQKLESATVYFRAKYNEEYTQSGAIQVTIGGTSSTNRTLTTSWQTFNSSIPVSELSAAGESVQTELTLTTQVQGGSTGQYLKYRGDTLVTQVYIEVTTTQADPCDINMTSRGLGTAQIQGETTIRNGQPSTTLMYPSSKDSKVIYIVDNGTSVIGQIEEIPITYHTFTQRTTGASYGFTVNSSGYWQSQNTNNQTAAVAQISFNCEQALTVTFDMINYNRANYDYGLVGKVDTALGTTYQRDTSTKIAWDGQSHNSQNVQNVSIDIPAGEHFIQIKFIRSNQDTSTRYNNNFQVKINSLVYTETGEPVPEFYNAYTIDSVTEDHNIKIIFDTHFRHGYIKQEGVWELRRMYQKINGVWTLVEGVPTGYINNDKILEKQ